MTNIQKLQETIERSGLKKCFIADSLGLSRQGLQDKLNGKSEFKASEIDAFSVLLRLDSAQRDAIFFAAEVT